MSISSSRCKINNLWSLSGIEYLVNTQTIAQYKGRLLSNTAFTSFYSTYCFSKVTSEPNMLQEEDHAVKCLVKWNVYYNERDRKVFYATSNGSLRVVCYYWAKRAGWEKRRHLIIFSFHAQLSLMIVNNHWASLICSGPVFT